MSKINIKKIIPFIERILDHVGPRLINHGKRVAYFVYKAFENSGFSQKELQDAAMLGLLHDIGAYKTEEIDKILQLEYHNTWNHSIYGYLLFKYFSTLKDLAPVILFHHADYSALNGTGLSNRDICLTQMIGLCDRAEVFSRVSKDIKPFKQYLEDVRGKKFCGEVIDLFNQSNPSFEDLDERIARDERFYSNFSNAAMSDAVADGYVNMLIGAIDYRSTPLHAFSATSIAVSLAKLLNYGDEEIRRIEIATALHDIGKVGVPSGILEKPGKLTPREYDVMKTHVVITRKILHGLVDDDIEYLACRHHERLNGSGYKMHLFRGNLSSSERLIAVADIFSALCSPRPYKEKFSKEKVIEILTEMAAAEEIDAEIAAAAIRNYDFIFDKSVEDIAGISAAYARMRTEFLEIKEKRVQSCG
jgi:HD-GYP domain-containing protein (c-di-GMP phosphodiesterase class II)